MRSVFKTAMAIAIIAIAVCGIIVARQPAEKVPVRGSSPSGYEEYAAAVDPEFCKTVASQLAALGDDPALGFRSSGSPAEEEAAGLLAQTMKDIGLENVTVDRAAADGWIFGGANISFKDERGHVTTAALGGYQTDIVAHDERLPIVYLGKGTAADYKGIDVRGKLVLIDIDQENEWWINYPAYQAHLKGARAVVACSIMEEDIGARVVSQDICGDAGAPALAISSLDSDAIRRAIDADGYDEGGVKQIDVVLNADSKVTMNEGTRNIWGEIPGMTDEAIMFIAHYDGYYHSFYDDASGVGLILGIAKAFRESEVKPEKTLRFILHGAEEWGRSGTEADWATGAYEQIVNIRPEWAERSFALFNIDSGYPLSSMKSFSINAPVELKDFARSSIVSFGDRSEITVSPAISSPSTYREDFIYNACGVPTFATEGGEGDEQYFASMYHSSMDDLAVGGYSDAGALCIGRYIGYSTFMLDDMPLRPLKFANRLEHLKDTLEDYDRPVFDAHLMANLDRSIRSAKALDSFTSDFNTDYRLAVAKIDGADEGSAETSREEAMEKFEETRKLAAGINDGIYAVYREMQDELLRLDRNLEPGFANEGIQHNITMLYGAREALAGGDAKSAIDDYLSGIESVYAATAFDADTCDKFSKGLDESVKGTWAEGRLVSRACRADDIVRAILSRMGSEMADALYGSLAVTGAALSSPSAVEVDPSSSSGAGSSASGEQALDFAAELAMIDELIKSQEDTLIAVYNGQEDALARLTDSMNELLDTYADDARVEDMGL
ncbi:MAG: M28 family peptidase [Clostridiales Family XIII bacterium]|jgi:hypothetical protein|nr:M28 family peptidase [Clostridiales Family XIII bacterium]